MYVCMYVYHVRGIRFLEPPFEQRLRRVSNNLGVYFLFCLFGLVILALFLCRSMQALQKSLVFFVLRRQPCINKFLQAGYSGFQVTGMVEC